MSVIKLKPEEFGIVAETILYGSHNEALRGAFYGWSEKYENAMFRDVIKDPSEHLENAVKCWADRLYMANQLAYGYTYKLEKITVERLTDSAFNIASPLSLRKLYSGLSRIEYNLWADSGNGRIFLGGEDKERLERLINLIAKLLVIEADYQSKEALAPRL